MSTPRILIEGVGGIGGVVAGAMIRAGHAPVLVTGNPEIAEAIRRDGLRYATPEGEWTVPAEAHAHLEDVERGEGFDWALLIMKATSVVESAERTLPLLHPERGTLVTCQNGVVEDAVAAVAGAQRVVSAIIGWGGTLHGPGHAERTSPGETHIGELDGRITPRIRELKGLLDPSAPAVISDNIRGALWSKLAINCMITTIGALTGDTLGAMMRDARVRRAFLGVYREVVDTAEARGVKLERVAAPPKLLYCARDAGWLQRTAKDLLARLVGRKYGKLKSSMLQSLERGRQTEIDFLNGYVVEQAAQAGQEVPFNAALVRLIKEIESGERPITRQNLDRLGVRH